MTITCTRIHHHCYHHCQHHRLGNMNLRGLSRYQGKTGKNLFASIVIVLSACTTAPYPVSAASTRFYSSSSSSSSLPLPLSSLALASIAAAFQPTATTDRRALFGSSRNFLSTSSDDGNDSSSTTTTSFNIEELALKLSNSEYKNIIVLVGAGASVSAGIPDFRTPGSGLYDQMQKYDLPYPEAIFDLDYYRTNPKPFIDLCSSIWPGKEHGPKPTYTHKFLKVLQDKGYLRRIYTQNIDGLESLAGISTDKLVECHGHFRSASCISCKTPVKDVMKDCYEEIVNGNVPICSACSNDKNYIKPDIVFFGEELPSRFQSLIYDDVEQCDLLLIIGTSLLVMPVAGIPSWVNPSTCPRILFNRELVGDFRYTCDTEYTTTNGTNGNNDNSIRDLFLQGDCDDTIKQLCTLAGWEKKIN